MPDRILEWLTLTALITALIVGASAGIATSDPGAGDGGGPELRQTRAKNGYRSSIGARPVSARPVATPRTVRLGACRRDDSGPGARQNGRVYLRRFDDGSAWLLCGQRIMARINSAR
jgi:hypothetical protein